MSHGRFRWETEGKDYSKGCGKAVSRKAEGRGELNWGKARRPRSSGWGMPQRFVPRSYV